MPLLMEDLEEAPRAALPKTPVLITAATIWEFSPLAKALNLTKTAAGRAEGSVAGRRVVLLKTGIGAKNAADALGNGFAPSDFGLAISAGLCGAMQKEAKTGHLVADAREADLDLVKPLRTTALALGMPFHFGKILHTNIVLQPAAKKALGEEQRALACDMETASLRRWADGKTDAIAVRVILDEVNDILPGDMPEGEDFVSLARYALTHASTLPSLIGTGMRSARAMKTLSRFLKAYLETI
jgi:nucleoside phosphorylase